MRWLCIVTLVIHLTCQLSQACPLNCSCKWKSGKQAVECLYRDLITIPDGIDPGTQILDMAGNILRTLPRERFQRMGLLNLQKIFLSRCRIDLVDDRAFRGLTNLVELDLSYNQIELIPSEAFRDFPSLMRLNFANNPIVIIESGSFRLLPYLTNLDLNACRIETIEEDAFAGLDRIEWIKLDGNLLATIRGASTLPNNLHGLDLHNNPWFCDCWLLELRGWLISSRVPMAIEIQCTAPERLKGKDVKTLNPNELACLPDVTPTTLYLEIAEGKNVSLLCKVSAIPEARVSWWFQGRVLQNDSIIAPGLHFYYFLEDGVEEKKSELFIYNTNTEDNGTFICLAENPAGRAQSNFTIRILVKEEPLFESASFPYELIITLAAGITSIILLIIVIIIICVIKCRKRRRNKRRKERNKSASMRSEQSARKSNSEGGSRGENLPSIPLKFDGSVLLIERQQEHLMMGGNVSELTRQEYPSAPTASLLTDPRLEQNPDLINDAESVGKERRPGSSIAPRLSTVSDHEPEDNSTNNSYQEAMENLIHEFDKPPQIAGLPAWVDIAPPYQLHLATLPRGAGPRCTGNIRELYPAGPDFRLSPGRFLDRDGYPIHYGLPKIATHLPIIPPNTMYRTLPHNRSGAEHATRYVREQPYETYSPSDVRYTVDGYPCAPQTSQTSHTLYSIESYGSFPDGSYIPSPPAPYKGDIGINDTTSKHGTSSECDQDKPNENGIGSANAANTIELGASSSGIATSGNDTELFNVLGLTDSPDEGYEGEICEGGDTVETSTI